MPRVGLGRNPLIYIFADEKLVRANYISDAKHTDLNDFITDFRDIEPAPEKKYGKPFLGPARRSISLAGISQTLYAARQ